MKSPLEQINDIALRFLEPLTTEETYRRVCEESMKLIGGDYCSVYLMKKGNLEKVHASDSVLLDIKAKRNGYAYKVFKTHRVIITHVQEFGEQYPLLKKLGVKTSTLIPLSYKKSSIGVLIVQSKRKKNYKKNELRMLELLGSMASLAIQKTQMSEEARHAIASRDYFKAMEHSLENIHTAGLKFLTPLSSQDTFSVVAREAMKLVKADYASIFIKTGVKIDRVYASHPQLYAIQPRKRGNVYTALAKKTPVISTIKQLRKTHPEVTTLHVKSNVIVPLINQDKTVGALTLMSETKERFTKYEINILKLYGNLASLAIRKTQLFEEAKKALEIRDLFIAMAAHELRTPLTTLNGYLQLLSYKIPKTKKPETEWIAQLLHESSRLTHLVQELLEINKIQSGKLQYNYIHCSLRDIVNRVITNFTIANPQRKFVYADKLGTTKDFIIADYNKLIQVFSNVLNNAAKFSPQDKPIKIILAKDGKYFTVTVRDYGQGISKEEQDKIFQVFYKGSHNLKEGMGLGLYLAKSIVEKHKGEISIESQEKKGTIVTVVLPRTNL